MGSDTASSSSSRVEAIGVGTTIGKFRVERVVGRGGMGLVVEATNTQLDERVALKLLTIPGDEAAQEATLREARAAARLRSDHVARIQDVDVDPTVGPYIVMELLRGTTLAEALDDVQRISVQRATEYAIQACEGLAEAHVRKIVHQDIKPGNLFLATGNDGRPSVKVLDFGIAKTASVDLRTSGGADLGTPFYLSPEQLRKQAVDHRADIWALGCVLFELVTGVKAFEADQLPQLVTKVLEGRRADVPPGVEVPPELLAVIDRCLEKDPAKRFASTGELALAILPFAKDRAHSVAGRAVAHVRDAGLDPHLEMPSTMPPRPSMVEPVHMPAGAALRPAPPPRIEEPAESEAVPPMASDAPVKSVPPARRAAYLSVAGVVLLGVAIAAWLARSPTPSATTVTSASGSAHVGSVAAPSATVTAAATSATVTAAVAAPSATEPPSPSASVAPPQPATRPPSGTPAPPPRTTATGSPAPRGTDNEIRRER